MPVRAMQSPLVGGARRNTMRIPQTGVITRENLKLEAAPSRRD